MSKLGFLLLGILALVVVRGNDMRAATAGRYRITHKVNGGNFEPRGTLEVTAVAAEWGSSSRDFQVDAVQPAPHLDFYTRLQDCAAKGEGYTLRIETPSDTILESQMPCHDLWKVGLQDRIVLVVDAWGTVTGVNHMAETESEAATPGNAAPRFSTHVEVLVPFTATPLKTLEEPKKPEKSAAHASKEAKAGAAEEPEVQEEEKSFFQKYWHYLLPLLFIIINGFLKPPAEDANANAANGAAANPRAGRAAAPPTRR